MKSWKKWYLAVLLSIGASSAFADGSCQSGFSLRSYPFYDKAGAYIGMRQACAPIPCTPGYQDSTCAAPLRNGAIPQPQCQSGAGWTMVAAAVWQGSRWSEPQCSFQSPPSCPAGFDMLSPPTWNGQSWGAPTCAAPLPPAPVIDPNQVCTAVASGYRMSDADRRLFASFDGQITRDAPFQVSRTWRDWSTIPGKNPNYPYGGGYTSDKYVAFYGALTGPWYLYQLACQQSNTWEAFCYVNRSTGTVDYFWINATGANNGQCNH